jgi:ketosteroid isomerase-like protein
VKVVAVDWLQYYLNAASRRFDSDVTLTSTRTKGVFMKRSLVIVALGTAALGCAGVAVNTAGSARDATEAALMQADRDFAVATHSRGIDGWMSFYASDAIRIRYGGNMIRGLAEIRRFDLPTISDTTSTLNWEPTDAYIFRGGSLGSTTGRYWVVSRKAADAGKELGRGRYVTMWRREGARWLVIMDTGYPDPSAARE